MRAGHIKLIKLFAWWGLTRTIWETVETGKMQTERWPRIMGGF